MHSPLPASPAPNVRYPLKLGRSVRKTATARSFVQLKFSHIGASVDIRRPGLLTPSKNACSIALPTVADPPASVSYAASRVRNVSDVGTYVLVFAADAFWLERVDDVFVSTRAGTLAEPVHVPAAADDEFAAEPESWMDVDASGSPVTPDTNDADEDAAARPAAAAKSAPQPPRRKTLSAPRTLQPMPEPAAHAHTAMKTVASKSVPAGVGAAAFSAPAHNGVEEEVEEVEEVDASSSDDDADDASSDESDSSDSADSAEYTDRSSDED
eukprot:TRINITY_DN832_c0_g1_i5.p2 TRINITY_DN832_c0_g1~~TRINITY_DN832_c0_g1_i5.p2  ORF type:complete len:285 (+),score=86.75 TRINITY_DN832_c0_g1_i5:51-857(+)